MGVGSAESARSPAAAASKLMWVKNILGRGTEMQGDNLSGPVKVGNSQEQCGHGR